MAFSSKKLAWVVVQHKNWFSARMIFFFPSKSFLCQENQRQLLQVLLGCCPSSGSTAEVPARFIFLLVFSGYDSWFRLFAPKFCLSNAGLNKLALRAAKYLRPPILFQACNRVKPVGLQSWYNPVASGGFCLKVVEDNIHLGSKIHPDVSAL